MACEPAHRETGGGEADEGVRGGQQRSGNDEGQQRAEHPRERRVEDEARLAGVEGGGKGPARLQGPVAELLRRVEPGLQVEVDVVAAGAAEGKQRQDCDQGGAEDQDVVAPHGVSVSRRSVEVGNLVFASLGLDRSERLVRGWWEFDANRIAGADFTGGQDGAHNPGASSFLARGVAGRPKGAAGARGGSRRFCCMAFAGL